MAAVNNGNVTKQTITVPTVGVNTGFTAVQSYQYDSLNRLKDATEHVTPHGGSQSQSWRQALTFDRYGNRNFDEANTTTLPKECNGNTEVCEAIRPIVNPSANTANNRLNGYTFDASGNTTVDAENRIFIYDAENKQTEVRDSQNTVIGQYRYDASGKSIAEYSTVVESVENAKVAYLTADHLGSPRIKTDKNGSVTSRTDYMPYGEEIIALGNRTANENYVSDDVRQGFTGYENDEEVSLYYARARNHNFNLGRFQSPDPFGGITITPQSLNKYAYVINNPLKFVDPTGEIFVVNGDEANALVSELEAATGYKLYRCSRGDKTNGCSREGQVIIDPKNQKRNANGTSKKLADKLLAVMSLKKDGKDVTVSINTTRDDGNIAFDSYKARTVDVGDIARARQSGGGVSFAAGQLAHVLEEYSQSDLLYGEGVNMFDGEGKNAMPATHGSAISFESEVVGELENEILSPRREAEVTGLPYVSFIYDGKDGTTNKVRYQVEWMQEKGKIINNVKEVKRFVPPR